MLKRIITRLKRSLRLPVVMAEQVGQEKRAGDAASEEQTVKKQKCEARSDRKRKVALLISYNGKGYYGLQVNPGFPTVESELCKALLNVGLIPQDHHDAMQKMSFQRAARTDKGVSAASNVISLKMLLNVDNMVEKINEQLPSQIRVMGCKRTTNSFNSKNFCDSRTYNYMLPTLAFAPLEENVTYSYRTTQEIMDRVNFVLKKYLGTHPFHNFTSGITAEERSCRRYIKFIEFNVPSTPGMKRVLRKGTRCGEPFIRNDVEFAVISVWGQSFMLHQIRKMVGLSIAIVKGYCGEEAIDQAWNPEKMDVPKAPGLGLVLEKLHYDNYNRRYGSDGQHEALDWSNIQDKLDKFKEEQIFSEIIKTEIEECSMLNWLSTLHIHSYSTEDNWWYKRKSLEKLSESAKLKTGQSETENTTDTNEKVHKDIPANQTVDDKMSASNETIDNNQETFESQTDSKTDKYTVMKETVTTKHQHVETNIEKRERTTKTDTECVEINEIDDLDSDIADRQIKKAENS